MKVLLDSCVSGRLRDALAAAEHDVEWCGDWPRDPGDETILGYAHEHQRTLVTLDKDFGELAIMKGRPHSGIVRLVGLSLKMQVAVMLDVIRRHGTDLEHGAIVTATGDRLRIRSPD